MMSMALMRPADTNFAHYYALLLRNPICAEQLPRLFAKTDLSRRALRQVLISRCGRPALLKAERFVYNSAEVALNFFFHFCSVVKFRFVNFCTDKRT